MRLRAGSLVTRGWTCERCDEPDAFVTEAFLGDYANCRKWQCHECGYCLTDAEMDELERKALESAADDLIGEYEDHLRERDA